MGQVPTICVKKGKSDGTVGDPLPPMVFFKSGRVLANCNGSEEGKTCRVK